MNVSKCVQYVCLVSLQNTLIIRQRHTNETGQVQHNVQVKMVEGKRLAGISWKTLHKTPHTHIRVHTHTHITWRQFAGNQTCVCAMRYYCVYAGWNLKVYFHKKTVQILLRRCLPHLAKSHSYLSSSSSFTGHTAVMMTDSQFHYHISTSTYMTIHVTETVAIHRVAFALILAFLPTDCLMLMI